VTAVPPFPPPVQQIVAAVRTSLDRLIAENHLGHLPVHSEVREGNPFQEIVQFARDRDVDLIVMGTHGRSGLVHVLMGSVTEKVVRKAPCPVLTVRHPEHEFVHP
jgi:nucleotide-binding universal stress UspA family protein